MRTYRLIHTVAIFALALSSVATTGFAAGRSPFVGEWQAVDADGGAMRLTIGGGPSGPFNITWTEGYFGLCDGGPGIGRGDGWVSPVDLNLLEGHLVFDCFTTGTSLEADVGWHYDPASDTLTAYGGEGETNTVWHRPSQTPTPPDWLIIARPADEGVDGGHFPEGTVVSVLVLDDEHNVRWYGTDTAIYPEWDPDHTWVTYSLDIDLMAGDHVWMYDGTNAKELIVSTLEVTSVDLGSHTVSGSAAPNSDVFVDLPGGTIMVTAASDGRWSAPFDDSAAGQWWGAYQPDADNDQTRAPFYVPNPHFTVFPEGEWMDGYDWPEGPVTITVEGKAECEVTHDSSGGFFNGSFGEGCDLQVGDTVTFNNGSTERTHTVRNLTVTSVDMDADTVAGTADDGATVHAWIHEVEGSELTPTATGGSWLAEFGAAGFPLERQMCGRSEVRDEVGNSTAVDWCTPNTRMTIFLDAQYIEGYEWPEGTTVTLSVAGKDACTSSATSHYPEWDPQHTFLSIGFPDGCSVAPGDEVSLSDGSFTISHIVQDLAITGASAETDIVTGTASFDPDSYFLHTWIHGFDGSEVQPPVETGTWQVNYGELEFDLQPGMAGRAEIVDQASNATAVDWHINNPRFTVFPEGEWMDGYDWPDGSVTISVEGKAECEVTHESSGGFFNGSFGEGCNLQMGDVVTFTDGTTTRTHEVRSLAVSEVNAAANTVSGTATSGDAVFVWVHEHGETEMQLLVEDGTWLADFGSFDLTEGMCGRSEIRDDAGNSTAVDWCVPSMPTGRVIAFPAVDEVFAYEWPEGSQVTLSIDGSFVQEAAVAPSPWGDPNDILAFFSFTGQHDLQPDEQITLAGSGMELTYTVRGLAVTAVDAEANTVAGTADPGAEVVAGVFGWGQLEDPIVAGDGTWVADFGAAGLDLSDGMCGRAQVFDESSNSTAWDWCIEAPPPPPEEQWVWAYTYDLPAGSWTAGEHTYIFTMTSSTGGLTGDPHLVAVSSEAGLYEGFVLLDPWGPHARSGDACEAIAAVHPDQPTRFRWGWATDEPMTSDEALALYESMQVSVSWDGGPAIEMVRRELMEADAVDWGAYVCGLTQP